MIRMGDACLPVEESTKFLGVWLDKYLPFTALLDKTITERIFKILCAENFEIYEAVQITVKYKAIIIL